MASLTDDLLTALTSRPISDDAIDRLRTVRHDAQRLLSLARDTVEAAAEHAGWFLGAIYSWLPDDLLAGIASAAVADRSRRANPAADEIIAFASLQAPETLRPYLQQLWAADPNETTYYRTWPWRGADDLEVRRLTEIFRSRRDKNERRRVLKCLLQTRRPDVIRDLSAVDPLELQLVGFAIDGQEMRAVCAATIWHIAFPRDVVTEWQRRLRFSFRVGNPTWVSSDGLEPAARIGGLGAIACPQCGQLTHRLIQLRQVPSALGITIRQQLDFVWCGWCSCFSDVTFLRFDSTGSPRSMALDNYFDTGRREPLDPFPEFDVGLSSMGERWRVQDWAVSNSRENLHRIGGEPTWIQSPAYPSCPECHHVMVAIGQIAVEDLWDGEGIAYLLWCDTCAIGGVVYQQT